MEAKHLYLISRENVVEARGFLALDPSAAVLVCGRGLLLPANLFGKREIYAIAEEVSAFGLTGKLPEEVKIKNAEEILELIKNSKVFNFA